MTNHRGISKKK